MITEERDTAKRIRAYQVDQLYIRFHVVAPLTLVLIAVLIIIQWPVISHSILLVWGSVMFVIIGVR